MSEWIELKDLQAVALANAEGFEIQVNVVRWGDWEPWQGTEWNSRNEYRARPRQPKMKKVNILCLFNPTTGILFWRDENFTSTDNHWIRVPSEDKEIEVEE